MNMLMIYLRTSSHHLRCKTDKWTITKEEWEMRTCLFCNMRMVETQLHYIIECVGYNDIHIKYKDKLKANYLTTLFEEA